MPPKFFHFTILFYLYFLKFRCFKQILCFSQSDAFMKPILSKISHPNDSAILVKHDVAPYIDYPLHFHPEYELVLIEKGYGRRIIGDHVDNFTDGDLVFLSPNLPHIWQCHPDFYKQDAEMLTSCYVLHFKNDSLGQFFFDMPDLLPIKKLFAMGEQGILLKGRLKKQIAQNLVKLYHTQGIDRLQLFLDILKRIYYSKETELLSSEFYINPLKESDKQRFTVIYEYIMQNFKADIRIDDVAKRLNMTPTSLCRYFKKQSAKTLVEFINEIRIKYACRLLKNTEQNITEICFESGFNNLSNFNRCFRKVMNSSPAEYRKA
jgi:AraC-like DNA-binding protein